jgi:hypothetical protein
MKRYASWIIIIVILLSIYGIACKAMQWIELQIIKKRGYIIYPLGKFNILRLGKQIPIIKIGNEIYLLRKIK